MSVITNDDLLDAFNDETPPVLEQDQPKTKKSRGRPRKDGTPAQARKIEEKAKKESEKREEYDKLVSKLGKSSVDTQIATALYPLAALFAQMDEVCGTVFMGQVQPIAEALDSWCKTSPRVARTVAAGLTTSGPMMFLAATTPILITVYMHHFGPKPQPIQDEQNETIPQDPFKL